MKIMFLCTGNCCRSQMAEGFSRAYGGPDLEVYSAGTSPAGYVHPMAIAVMKEVGIDISDQESKSIDHTLLNQMDITVTLCSNAEASCPITPTTVRRVHWPIEDPIRTDGQEEVILERFRAVRDEIEAKVKELVLLRYRLTP